MKTVTITCISFVIVIAAGCTCPHTTSPLPLQNAARQKRLTRPYTPQMEPIVIGSQQAKDVAMLSQSDLEARLMAVQREVTSLTAETKTQTALRDKAKKAYDVAAPDTVELRVLEYAKAEASLAATSTLAKDQRQELSLILWEFCRRAKASVTRDK